MTNNVFSTQGEHECEAVLPAELETGRPSVPDGAHDWVSEVF